MVAKRLVVAALAATALVAVSCGSDAESAEGEMLDVPSVEMTEVATGDTTDLATALDIDGDKPTVAWFWAPHCSTCRGEAPALDEFMGENADRVNFVGIGSRDDFEYAEGFLADTGVENLQLLWEGTGESWASLGVTAQPYVILIDDGEAVQRWPGGVSPEVLDVELDKLEAA